MKSDMCDGNWDPIVKLDKNNISLITSGTSM